MEIKCVGPNWPEMKEAFTHTITTVWSLLYAHCICFIAYTNRDGDTEWREIFFKVRLGLNLNVDLMLWLALTKEKMSLSFFFLYLPVSSLLHRLLTSAFGCCVRISHRRPRCCRVYLHAFECREWQTALQAYNLQYSFCSLQIADCSSRHHGSFSLSLNSTTMNCTRLSRRKERMSGW